LGRGAPVSDGNRQTYPQLGVELSRGIRAGEIAVEQRIDVDGASLAIEDCDPFAAGTRRVYVRTPQGERVTVRAPQV
jgi:hypothetical protein